MTVQFESDGEVGHLRQGYQLDGSTRNRSQTRELKLDFARGGFGTPEDGDFAIEWRDHEISRRNLGYPETLRQLQIRLSRCHPTNGPFVRADLEAAQARHGTTVFDWLVEIINDQAPRA